jgi:hypothetical protein
MRRLKLFLVEDTGQDLIEFTLLIFFVVLASAGIFLGLGSSISGIVNTSNSQIVAANMAAS